MPMRLKVYWRSTEIAGRTVHKSLLGPGVNNIFGGVLDEVSC